jgi:hypothetical protein
VSWWNTSDITVSWGNVIANPIDSTTGLRLYRGTDPLRVVRVATSVDHPGLGFLSAIGISSPLTISVYHEERVIGD